AAAVSRVSPHARPAGVAASADVAVSFAQPVPPGAESCTVPPRRIASSLPSEEAARAPGSAARPPLSRPGDQLAPLSDELASGENVRSWLGTNPVTSRPVACPATVRPPLSATPFGVASFQPPPAEPRVNSCQKLLCLAADPPISTTAQAAPPW